MDLIRIKDCMVNLNNVITINYDERKGQMYVIGKRDSVASIIDVNKKEAMDILKMLEEVYVC